MEPSNLPDQRPDADASVSDGVYRAGNAAANEHMPKSIWQPGVVQRLGDYIKHLREVDQQPDQPDKSCQSAEPKQSNHVCPSHVCPRHHERTCNCARSTCADDDTGATSTAESANNVEPTRKFDAFYSCPISGRICLGIKCREWCQSGVDRSKT